MGGQSPQLGINGWFDSFETGTYWSIGLDGQFSLYLAPPHLLLQIDFNSTDVGPPNLRSVIYRSSPLGLPLKRLITLMSSCQCIETCMGPYGIPFFNSSGNYFN